MTQAPTPPAWSPRLAGTLALTASALMLIGAALWAGTGTDLDLALMADEVAAYLESAGAHRDALVANLTIWIVGATLLGVAGIAMTGVGSNRGPARDLALLAYGAGVPVAILAFLAWLAIIVQGSPTPSPMEVAVAEVVGWFAYRADSVATALLIGAGPAFLASAGRAAWVPGWLHRWGWLAAAAGGVSFLPYFLPIPLGLTFLIVPIGLGWTIAAGVVLLRLR